MPVQDVGATATRRRREFKKSIPYWGAGVQVDIEDMVGSVSAFDANGDEKWRWRNDLPMCASVLATGGDLVFAGEPSGEFVALDARTGEQLWKFQCGSGHHSSPTTYMVDGRPYVAVPGRVGRVGRGVPARHARRRPRQRTDRLRAPESLTSDEPVEVRQGKEVDRWSLSSTV